MRLNYFRPNFVYLMIVGLISTHLSYMCCVLSLYLYNYHVFGIKPLLSIVGSVFKLLTVYSDSQRVAYPLICVRLSLLYAMISNQLWCSFNYSNVSCGVLILPTIVCCYVNCLISRLINALQMQCFVAQLCLTLYQS